MSLYIKMVFASCFEIQNRLFHVGLSQTRLTTYAILHSYNPWVKVSEQKKIKHFCLIHSINCSLWIYYQNLTCIGNRIFTLRCIFWIIRISCCALINPGGEIRLPAAPCQWWHFGFCCWLKSQSFPAACTNSLIALKMTTKKIKIPQLLNEKQDCIKHHRRRQIKSLLDLLFS